MKQPVSTADPRAGRGLTSWLLAALVAGAALVGLLVILIVVFISLDNPPPFWVQLAIGIGLVLGATLFAWLLASALSSVAAAGSGASRPRATPSRDDEDGSRSFSEVS